MGFLRSLLFMGVTGILFGCGGGGGSNSTPTPPTTPATPAPASSNFSGIELGQSLLFSSNDPALTLVANRDVFLRVKAFALNSPLPTLSAHVKDATGNDLGTLFFNPPTTPANQKPDVFSLAQSYTATLPKNWVTPGMQVVFHLPSLAPDVSISPQVLRAKHISITSIPVQIDTTVLTPPSKIDEYLGNRFPVSDVSVTTRTPYVSTSVTTLPQSEAEWETAFPLLLEEVERMRTLEQPASSVFYFGSIPKSTMGLAGISWMGGRSGVGFTSLSEEKNRQVMMHELGHNMGLLHAPCGGPSPSSVDQNYPYPDALLGMGTHFVWGFNRLLQALVDPTPVSRHDPMSYCSGDWFSDYHFLKLSTYLDNNLAAASVQSQYAAFNTPVPLMLISGQIDGEQFTVRPVTAFNGVWDATATRKGEYVLTVVSNGKAADYPFEAHPLTHSPTQLFSFSIPHPGGNVESLSIHKSGQLLWQSPIFPSKALGRMQAATVQQNAQLTPSPGDPSQLQLDWNHLKWPYASVVLIQNGSRTALTVQAKNGRVVLTLPTQIEHTALYEVSLSDGLNTMLLQFNASGQPL